MSAAVRPGTRDGRGSRDRKLHRHATASASGNADSERGAERTRGRRRRTADERTRKRAAPPPPVAGDDDAAHDARRSGRAANRDAELTGAVHEIVGDAAARKGDHALRQQVQ